MIPVIFAMLAAAAATGAQAHPAPSEAARFDACVALAASDPAAARADAGRWGMAGGGWFARECAGQAFATEQRWPAAAGEFAAAAKAADLAHDTRGARYWAQAGNAWLAAGDATRARGALDTALVSGSLGGLALGEAQLDHARAMVALGELDGARTDLDLALQTAGDDPLAWLLSATLARRTGDLRRAKTDIHAALTRSADDASVQLEAGNIAALDHDEAGARAAWALAARLAPNTDVGRHAVVALRQFDAPAK